MDKIIAALLVFVAGLALALVFGFLMAFPVMWMWNYVCAGTLGLPVFDVWHAWALSILCSWLFKSNTSSSSSK